MRLAALATLLALAATPAFAIDVSRQVTFDGDPAAVWAVAGPFCAIGTWHPAIERCTEGTADGRPQRTLALKGGGTIVETEEARDEAGRSYSYRIIDSPLPVADYMSTLTVGNGTITWSGTFDAKNATDAEAEAVIAGIYEAGLQGIKDKLPK